MSEQQENKTTFGFKRVDPETKTRLVTEVFQRVAPRYDLMNDLMSVGLHRLWKRYALNKAALRPDYHVLDVAAGTGDLTKLFAKNMGPKGKIISTDINEKMLEVGRNQLLDAGLVGNIAFVQADASSLPFINDQFDRIMIAFGLRNVTNKHAALAEFYRVLKPGGKLLILEFSHPQARALQKIYDFYSFNIIPKIGEWVAKDRESYQYLVESIRMHPNQEKLCEMLNDQGFEQVTFNNLNGGIVALHEGYKY